MNAITLKKNNNKIKVKIKRCDFLSKMENKFRTTLPLFFEKSGRQRDKIWTINNKNQIDETER